MTDLKTDIETKAADEEKAKEEQAQKMNNNVQSGFFSPDNIKNLLMKHNNAITQIEKTLKKMIYVEDDMCLKAQKIHCLSCG